MNPSDDKLRKIIQNVVGKTSKTLYEGHHFEEDCWGIDQAIKEIKEYYQEKQKTNNFFHCSCNHITSILIENGQEIKCGACGNLLRPSNPRNE